MVTRNVRLVSKERAAFNILGRIELCLPGPWWWHTEDIDEQSATGAIFRAYADDGAELAHLIVVDVTTDASEPDVSSIRQNDVPNLDHALQSGIRQHLAAQGIEVLKWMSSHLNETTNLKALVTAYVVKDNGKDRQMIAARLTIEGRKMILMGCFDVTAADILAVPIYRAMQEVTIVPRGHI
jgi:hypothetical protein